MAKLKQFVSLVVAGIRLSLAVAVFCCVVAVPASFAEFQEFAVEGLQGLYEIPQDSFETRSGVFSTDFVGLDVVSVRMAVEGTCKVGLSRMCGEDSTFAYGILLNVEIYNNAQEVVLRQYSYLGATGEFDFAFEREFYLWPSGLPSREDLSFLCSGTHTIELTALGNGGWEGECPVEWPEFVDILSASVLVETASPVGVHSSTLGGIKALYR